MESKTEDFEEVMGSVDKALVTLDTDLITSLLDELLSVSEQAEASESRPPKRKWTERLKAMRGKRTIGVRLAVLLVVVAVAGTALALTQTTLTTELIEIFTTQYGTTDFSVASFDTKPQGNNKLTIDITLDNNDGANPHYANVTMNLINATGDEFLNSTQATGSVAASGSWSYSFVFNQANVVPDYQDSQIIIDQSS